LAQVVLFGVAKKPEELLEPKFRRIDEVLDDDKIVDEILGGHVKTGQSWTGQSRPVTLRTISSSA
jgi:hypothetical protein